MITYFISIKYGKDISRKYFIARLIQKEEVKKRKGYLKSYHYLGYKWIPGESLQYVALLDVECVACTRRGSASLKCKVMDDYIGCGQEMKIKRLYSIINNARFFV